MQYMNTEITISVTPDQKAQIDQWTDGQTYPVTLSQADGQLSIASLDEENPESTPVANDEPDEAAPGVMDPGMMGASGSTIPSKNPVDRMIAAKRGTSGY